MAAKKITYGVAGLPHQRTSPRTYTHAIVGKRDVAADRVREERYIRDHATDYWEYYAEELGEPIGQYDVVESYVTRQARAQEVVELGRDAWVERAISENLARFDATANDLLHVIQWSQSLGAAQRACGAWIKRGWHAVRVVDAFPVKKTRGAPNSIGAICK